MFSIITPTYNREKLLVRVLDSLKNQTLQDFEWIIIDDASTDQTEALVQEWKLANSSMDISYIKQEINKGKSHAVNTGVKLCKYDYAIIADSDDSFAPNTLEDLKTIWSSTNQTPQSNKIAAIWTLVKNEAGERIGDKFPHDFWQVDFNTRVLKNTIEGEKWHCWKTRILKEFPMYASSECAIEESTNWNRINKQYDFLCVNKTHRIYFYSEDGLIAKPKTRKELAKSNYFSSYYALKDVTIKDLLLVKHYRDYSFNYIKSRLHYKNKEIKLGIFNHSISVLNFICIAPIRALNKVL